MLLTDKLMLPKSAIIGATGFIGRNFLKVYREIQSDCIGACRDSQRADLSFLDLLSPSIMPLKLSKTGHREVLILAGVTKISECEKNKELTKKINVDGTLNLIEQLIHEGIKPIFFSSDYVFDGIHGNYDEMDLPNPVNEYGRQKAEVESRIKEICSGGNYLIIRLPKVFSIVKNDGTLFDEMALILSRGGIVRAAYDQIFSPVYVFDLVNVVMVLQAKGVKGVVNINPPEIWSRYDLALKLAQYMGADSSRVERISLADLKEPFNRPRNTSMKVDRMLREIDYKFTPIRQCVERVSENWKERVASNI